MGLRLPYNQTVKSILIALCFVCLVACGGPASDEDAVRQGVIDHLSGRAGLDIGSMDIKVTSVEFDGDQAEATVAFQAKGSADPSAGMQMKYTLERKGRRWVVQDKSGAGDGMHGGGMESPHGGGMGSPQGGGMENPHGGTPPQGELPEGHPPVTPDSSDSPG